VPKTARIEPSITYAFYHGSDHPAVVPSTPARHSGRTGISIMSNIYDPAPDPPYDPNLDITTPDFNRYALWQQAQQQGPDAVAAYIAAIAAKSAATIE
jgi:hypothetical protein